MKNLSHSKYDCKYHVVFVPKYRKKKLYGKIREYLKKVFHELARQKECVIVSGNLVSDHVHMCIEIPPKYSVDQFPYNIFRIFGVGSKYDKYTEDVKKRSSL